VGVLAEAKHGDVLEVIEVVDPGIKIQCVRLGLQPGSRLECIRTLPDGPVVVRCGTCELAIGRPIACCIRVRSTGDPDDAGSKQKRAAS